MHMLIIVTALTWRNEIPGSQLYMTARIGDVNWLVRCIPAKGSCYYHDTYLKDAKADLPCNSVSTARSPLSTTGWIGNSWGPDVPPLSRCYRASTDKLRDSSESEGRQEGRKFHVARKSREQSERSNESSRK